MEPVANSCKVIILLQELGIGTLMLSIQPIPDNLSFSNIQMIKINNAYLLTFPNV
jgi:hypothetical protein